MSSPDIWVGTRAEIADHMLSMAAARLRRHDSHRMLAVSVRNRLKRFGTRFAKA